MSAGLIADPAAPYEALAEVIERELALVPSGDFQAIGVLKRERAAIVRSLPATPPPEARAALARCRAGQAQITVELRRLRERMLGDLRQLRLAQRAANGYRPAVPRAPRRRISASA
jgi:hypothetical protein